MFQGVNHCWSCLGSLRAGIPPVKLASGIELPCCLQCWRTMPIAEKLATAHKYAELYLMQKQRIQTIETLQSIENLFREALADFQKRSGREPWQTEDEDEEP